MATRYDGCRGKLSWPELVGSKAQKAVTIIESQNHRVEAIVVLAGSAVTTDFRCDRVWVWVDDKGVVVQVPQVG